MRLRANASAMPFGSMACASFAPRGALVGGGDGCAHRPAVSGLPLRRFPFFWAIAQGSRRVGVGGCRDHGRRRAKGGAFFLIQGISPLFVPLRLFSPFFAFFGVVDAKELGNLTSAQRDWLGPFDLRVCFSGSIGDGAHRTSRLGLPDNHCAGRFKPKAARRMPGKAGGKASERRSARPIGGA